uniref:Uncharacterized protein n=1 Tax=Meloidogyne incognita TaxID=6306 RepID=A0A914NI86_MELIC
MRIFYILEIGERKTKCFGCLSCSNRSLCIFFCILQLVVVGCSLFQHLYSWSRFGHVFKCNSNITAEATFDERLLAYDIVIFDFGLMNIVLKMSKCVANYLDGGYLRFFWCVEHTSALLILLAVLSLDLKKIWLYWPALFMQSSFVLGMAILSMATTPKILEAISTRVDSHLTTLLSIYVCGVLLNWMFTLVLWHHYWDMEKVVRALEENSGTEQRNTIQQHRRNNQSLYYC